jgi:hypothetical protein
LAKSELLGIRVRGGIAQARAQKKRAPLSLRIRGGIGESFGLVRPQEARLVPPHEARLVPPWVPCEAKLVFLLRCWGWGRVRECW